MVEAQQALYAWLRTRETWQLEQYGNVVVAGYVQSFDRLGYLIGPLAKHLIAFEGAALGELFPFLPKSGFVEFRSRVFRPNAARHSGEW
jgi:hypothetical protein